MEVQTKLPLQVRIDADLKDWMMRDARRCGLTLVGYIEKLIQHRKDNSPEIQDMTM